MKASRPSKSWAEVSGFERTEGGCSVSTRASSCRTIGDVLENHRFSRHHPAADELLARDLKRDSRAMTSAWWLRVSREAAFLSILVVVFSSLDAALTLLHVGVGGAELNPLMAAVLARGIGFFVTAKTFSTAAGVVFLASQERFPAARLALRSAAILYVLVLAYHGWLLSA